MEDEEETSTPPRHQWSLEDFLPKTLKNNHTGTKNEIKSVTQRGYSQNSETVREDEHDASESEWSLKRYLPQTSGEDRHSRADSSSNWRSRRDDPEKPWCPPHLRSSLVNSDTLRSTDQRYNQKQQQQGNDRTGLRDFSATDQRASHSDRQWSRTNDITEEQARGKTIVKSLVFSSSQTPALDNDQYNRSYVLNDGKQLPVDLNLLTTWSEMKDPNQLLESISSHKKQLEVFLDQQKLQEDCLVSLIKTVGKALDADDTQETVKQLLDNFCRTKFFDHLKMYTQEKQITDDVWDEAQEFFLACTKILEAILNEIPQYAKICITVTSDLVETARCTQSIKESSSLLAKIASLHEKSKQTFLEEEKFKQKSRGGIWMSNKFEEPPENFLELSIMPTDADLQENAVPFIRRVKTEGGYEDVHQYLDVQFRLMKQDFIIPLRNGIAEFKKNNCKPGFKSSNLRFYFDVRFVGTIVDKGIDHVLHVDDSKFHHIQFGHSKRLMFGSLLCLSKDNFKTVIFATVAQDISKLQEGFIVVNVKTGLNEVFNSTSSDIYIMAETTAYFESYCHVLEGLQDMVTKLPLQEYIVHCKTELKPPQYLLPSGGATRLPVYDLSCLMATEIPCEVPVLTTVKWPKADEMCLNESQREAAQLALTKELAIIQGPPGTGKTYVGLKVMQVLLENKDSLTGSDTTNSDPILVVCYTNHALDQFLEGVLNFCPDSIVRVGGQSKSEKLDKFNLRNLKKTHSYRRNLFDSSRMENIADLLGRLNQTRETLQIDIVTNRTLGRYMKETHLESFSEEKAKSKTDAYQIHAWLATSKQATQSVLSQMIKQHLIKLILNRKEEPVSEPNFLLLGSMDIIKRAQFYCYFLRWYEYECKRELQWLSTRPPTEANRKKILQKQFWLNTAGTQILPDHQLWSLLGEDVYQKICHYLKPDDKKAIKSDDKMIKSDDKMIEKWLLRPERSLHQQLDDVQSLTKEGGHQEDDPDSLGPDYLFIREQNDRMVDVDLVYNEKIKTHVKAAVNSLSSALKRAEALGIRDDVLIEDDLYSSEWKQVRKSKLNLRAVHRKLQFIKPMTEYEESNVKSVWDLELDKRFALYNLWVQRYKVDLTDQMEKLVKEYKSEQEKQKEAEHEETLCLLCKAKVIGMTTSGAAIHRAVLQAVGCRIIVVEEAAEVLESHIVTSLNENCQHLILIGDHQQLRPNPTVYQLAKEFGLEVSLFERLLKNKVPHVMLKEQHRMRPEISKIMRHIYPDLQDHPSVKKYEPVRGVSKNIFFIQHEHKETILEDSMSKANAHEAKFLAAFCKFLLNQDYKASQITILATYTGQVFEIRKVMKEQKLDPTIFVTSVDNYQGEENDIILLSLVRSNEENQVGFLKVDNRVCVALSRAKQGLFAIGNLHFLATQSKLWKKIVKTASFEDTIGSGLPVHCHNHPDFCEIAVSEKDFLKFPEGGCGRSCQFRLNCGHICGMLCHGYDLDHVIYKCEKPCAKVCEAGHPCKQVCYETCVCPVLVVKKMLCSEHEDKIPCHVKVETVICRFRCTSVLDCTHPCTGVCGKCMENNEHDKCVVKVDHKWPCGHNEVVPCYKTKLYHFCEEVCKVEQDCSHACTGTCGQCTERKEHDECEVQVGHQWPCGHTETVPCYVTKPSYQEKLRNFFTLPRYRLISKPKFTCKQVCGTELDCGHKCAGICGQCKLNREHDKCKVQVDHQWPCGHTENVPCHTTKSKHACKQVCGQEQDCSHTCPGICGQCTRRGKHDECQVQVDHQWPCGHTENVPCHTTKSKHACKQVCGAEQDCSHTCPGICGQCTRRGKHDECQVQVEHQWPCGHKEIVTCYKTKSTYQEPPRSAYSLIRLGSRQSSSFMCKQVCGVERDCGHACKGICGECRKFGKHAVCEEQVVRVKNCGHSIELPCYYPESQFDCKNVCGSDLQCGHQCAGICGQCKIKGVHEICKAPVKYQRKCGHVDETPCGVEPSETRPCKQICGAELKCGHFCKGACYECLHGIVHVACQERCTRSLPCGHPCGGFCSTPCLPCTETCPNRCRHGACFLERKPPPCGHACPPCMARWDYRCPHLQYTRVCSNTCDIKPCAKYCRKYMSSCKHRCSGMCGELCVCAKCDKIPKMVEIFSTKELDSMRGKTKSSKGSEDDRREAERETEKPGLEQSRNIDKHNQPLLKLRSCDHIFYLNDLDRYVNRFDNNGTTYIPCPDCQIPIQNCVRFENINIVRSRRRAVEKEKLQHETEISKKQTADLFASQKSLDQSLSTNGFLLHDAKNVTNIVTLRAVSFKLKCTFVLNICLAIIKKQEEATYMQTWKSWKAAMLRIKGRLTDQQKEEFTMELLRFYWFYCLSLLDGINIPDDVKEPQDDEIDAELKKVIKDLGDFKATCDTLTKAELVFDQKNKRIQTSSKSEEDKTESLLLKEASLKVLKTLASTDDDMLCHLIERNFQDLPKPDIADLPVETSMPQLDDPARQINKPAQLSSEEMSETYKARRENKQSQGYKKDMPQGSKVRREDEQSQGYRGKMPQGSKVRREDKTSQGYRGKMPQGSKVRREDEPSQGYRGKIPQDSKVRKEDEPSQGYRGKIPQDSKVHREYEPSQGYRGKMPQDSKVRREDKPS